MHPFAKNDNNFKIHSQFFMVSKIHTYTRENSTHEILDLPNSLRKPHLLTDFELMKKQQIGGYTVLLLISF